MLQAKVKKGHYKIKFSVQGDMVKVTAYLKEIQYIQRWINKRREIMMKGALGGGGLNAK